MYSLKASEQRRSELFAKQGRGQQFSNIKERDSWIKKVKEMQYICYHAVCCDYCFVFDVSRRQNH